jgi:hypothetical protein
MLRVDIPSDPPVTQFYGGSSIYALTPTTPEIVEAMAKRITTRRPDISPAWARATVLKKPPSWVREYLENQSVSSVDGERHAAP